MIRVYGQTDTTFTSNGDVVLRPLKAKVHKEDNGDYYLDLETGLEYMDYIVRGNIVVADMPQGEQPFRIDRVTKTKSRITARCPHVFYDTKNHVIPYSYPNGIIYVSAESVLFGLNRDAVPSTGFTTSSDIEGKFTLYYEYPSLYDAIMDIVQQTGGHLVRDGFTIALKASIGQDNGITVRYKKNLKDITCEENWDDVCTKILPIGKDGLTLDAMDPSVSKFIDSDTQYDIPYCKTVKFEPTIVSSSIPSLLIDLREQATAYLASHALPQVSYNLSANLDKITDLGDTISVIDERLGVDVLTHVIGFDYDCILKKYTDVQFGNFSKNLSGYATKVNKSIAQIAQNQRMGILGNKQLIFNSDNTVTWQ